MRLTSNSSKQTAAATLIAAFIVAGCASKQAGPQGTHEQMSRINAAPTAFVPDPDHAKVVFTTSGMPMLAVFYTSTSETPCEGFQRVGTVFDSGRRVLLPGIARLTEKLNKAVLRAETSRTINVEPGVPVQLEGKFGDETDPHSDSCGPIVSLLTPEKGHVYHVNFDFNGRQSCSLGTVDVTDAEHPAPVHGFLNCEKPRATR